MDSIVPLSTFLKCEQDHAMNGQHFVEWISKTSSFFRNEHGSMRFLLGITFTDSLKILGVFANMSIVIDNATWHNQLTELEQTKSN